MTPLYELVSFKIDQKVLSGVILGFLVLYALFGIREIYRYFPGAWRNFIDQLRKREFEKTVMSGAWVLATLGPFYITLEVLERLGVI